MALCFSGVFLFLRGGLVLVVCTSRAVTSPGTSGRRTGPSGGQLPLREPRPVQREGQWGQPGTSQCQRPGRGESSG